MSEAQIDFLDHPVQLDMYKSRNEMQVDVKTV